MTMDLAERIEQVHAARLGIDALVPSLREAVLLVPMLSPTAAMSVSAHGLTWICAFTGPDALARFAAARGEEHQGWRCHPIRGSDLLGGASGVAVDLGGERPMLFPAGTA